jgi:hypothetical protein
MLVAIFTPRTSHQPKQRLPGHECAVHRAPDRLSLPLVSKKNKYLHEFRAARSAPPAFGNVKIKERQKWQTRLLKTPSMARSNF